MSRSHVTGNKAEKKGASEWYRKIEQENLERIEREWKEREAKPQASK